MKCYCATLALNCIPHYFYKFENAVTYILSHTTVEKCYVILDGDSYVYYLEDESLVGWVDIIKCEDI